MAKLQYYMAIQAARRRIWIENAYFVPDSQIRQGLVAGGCTGRRRPRHRAGQVHRQPERPKRLPLPLRRASRRRGADLRVPADDDAQQGHGRRRDLDVDRVDQLRQPIDEEERRGERLRSTTGGSPNRSRAMVEDDLTQMRAIHQGEMEEARPARPFRRALLLAVLGELLSRDRVIESRGARAAVVAAAPPEADSVTARASFCDADLRLFGAARVT